mgnify:CR=1 FL=1|jgi:hypothetical protein
MNNTITDNDDTNPQITWVQGGFGQAKVRIDGAHDGIIDVYSTDMNGMFPKLIAKFNDQLGVRWADVVQMAKDSADASADRRHARWARQA